jgi:glutamate-1-semialdehyde 2,1-aminomutase
MNAFQINEIKQFKEEHPKSFSLWNRSLKQFSGGVNHNIRTLGLPLVDGYPVFIKKSIDITITDVDDISYTDFWLGHYSQILGHNNPKVRKAVVDRLQQGWMTGTVIEEQIILAEKLTSNSKNIEKVRFQTSGSESVMNAIRLARAYTKRDLIAKVDLGWHGTNETASNGTAPKIEESFDLDSITQKIVTFKLNQNSIEYLFKECGNRLSCIIIEPIIGGGGAFKVDIEILKLLREKCNDYNVILIFDEIISGYRFQYGLYQDKIKIYPDLTTLGKIIGGGFPIGGLGGIEEIMNLADPSNIKNNKVTIGGGTFSTHAISMVAGMSTLSELNKKKDEFEKLNHFGDFFQKELNSIFRENNKNCISTNFGSLIFINCLNTNPWEKDIPFYEIINNIDKKEQSLLQLSLLNRNIYGYHGIGSLSFLHSKNILQQAITTIEEIVLSGKT